MSVITVNERFDGPRSFSVENGSKREYTRTFVVVTNSVKDGKATILADSRIPQYLDTYALPGRPDEDDDGAYAYKFAAAQRSESPKVWDVTVSYSSERTPETHALNPLDRRMYRSWQFAKYQKAIFKDRNNRPIQSSAKEIYRDTVIDDSRPILEIVRNEFSFDAAVALDFQDAVNSAPFYGAAAGLCKCQSIRGVEVYDDQNGNYFWQVVYTFEFRREGWAITVWDQGSVFLSGGSQTQDYDKRTGAPMPGPYYLDGRGGKLPVGRSPIALTFDVYHERDFSSLNLGG